MRRTLATPYLATSASRPATILGDALSPSIRSASVEPLSCIALARVNVGERQRESGRIERDRPLGHDAREDGVAGAARMVDDERLVGLDDEVVRDARQAE